MANVITYGVTLDATGAINGFKKLDAAMDTSAKKALDYEKIGRRAGLAIAGALTYGVYKIISETRQAQAAQAQLAAVLKSTGAAAGLSAKALNEQAAALQRTTTYADDSVTAMQSVLLTFTKIRGGEFARATTAILDLSTALGQDLKGSAIQVGKALNDPVNGITALRRVGVSFSDAQEEVIKHLAETNRLAEAQAMILKELETEFGGSAAAARNTLGGALDALGNAWGDLFEISREGSNGMVSAINRVTAALPGVRQGIEEWIAAWDILATKTAIANENMIGGFARVRAAFFAGVNAVSGGTGGVRGAASASADIARSDATIAALKNLKTAQELAFASMHAGEDVLTRQAGAFRAIAEAAGAAGDAVSRLRPLGLGSSALNGVARPNLGGGFQGTFANGAGINGTSVVRSGKEIAAGWAKGMQDANDQIARNFRENVQGSVGGFFSDFLATGRASVASLFQGFRQLAADVLGQLAAKSIIGSTGGLGGLLKGPLGIGLGILGLGAAIFGRRSRGPSYGNNNTPTYTAGGTDPRQIAAREALAGRAALEGNQIRQSVGGTLTETSASRIVGNLESIRVGIFQLVALAQAGALGGNQVTVNASGTTSSGLASDAASAINRMLGGQVQQLRLNAGVAVLP